MTLELCCRKSLSWRLPRRPPFESGTRPKKTQNKIRNKLEINHGVNLPLRDAVLLEELVRDRSPIELVLDFQLLYWKGTIRLPEISIYIKILVFKLSTYFSFTLMIFSLGWFNNAPKWSRAPQFKTVWVCSSVPVTILPTARKAAVWTLTSRWAKRGTNFSTTLESMTIWICSLPPSVK